jgi:hypothetical protein
METIKTSTNYGYLNHAKAESKSQKIIKVSLKEIILISWLIGLITLTLSQLV